MVTHVEQVLPQLGSAMGAFVDQFGSPAQVVLFADGLLYEFVLNGQVLTVFSAGENADAVHGTYPTTGPGLLPPNAAWRMANGVSRRRMFVGDLGWVVVGPDCPATVTRRLRRLA
ncbi:MAG TPA: hypothetical protein VFA70_12030 [Dehalococcoidia bacterium]|jgi:hypothetical protein|nr:hypothetical protein [Dehalococcoidia bacterium]